MARPTRHGALARTLRLAAACLLVAAPVLLPAIVLSIVPPRMSGTGLLVAAAAIFGLWITARFGVPLARTPRD